MKGGNKDKNIIMMLHNEIIVHNNVVNIVLTHHKKPKKEANKYFAQNSQEMTFISGCEMLLTVVRLKDWIA